MKTNNTDHGFHGSHGSFIRVIRGSKTIWIAGSLLVSCAALFGSAIADVAHSESNKAPAILSGGVSTMDELIARFLTAIEKQDAEALHQLRVTKDEYLDIILPGAVEPGQPPARNSEKVRQFFWSMTDQKSKDFGHTLFQKFGGRHYHRKDASFTQPAKQHLWYTAHGQLRLSVVDDSGEEELIQSGWIIELAGRHKFLTLEWDD